MIWYSGFGFHNEQALFTPYLSQAPFSVAGFSYGAIKAFEYALTSHERVEKLILISPAFFNDQSQKFKRLQTLFLKKDPTAYHTTFMKNVLYPATEGGEYCQSEMREEDLYALLHYEWCATALKTLKARHITVEVHLGAEDKIINFEAAKAFFAPHATLFIHRTKGHLLKD